LPCPAFFGAHDKLEGTAANLFSRSDLDQVNPPLLGTGIPLPFPFYQDIGAAQDGQLLVWPAGIDKF